MNDDWSRYFDGALEDIIYAANTSLTRSLESKAAKKGKSKGFVNGKGNRKKGSEINADKGKKGNQSVPPWRRFLLKSHKNNVMSGHQSNSMHANYGFYAVQDKNRNFLVVFRFPKCQS